MSEGGHWSPVDNGSGPQPVRGDILRPRGASEVSSLGRRKVGYFVYQQKVECPDSTNPITIKVLCKNNDKTFIENTEHESFDTMSDIDKNDPVFHVSSPPLKFSSRHGDNCQILRDGSQAKRAESFCKGEGVMNDEL